MLEVNLAEYRGITTASVYQYDRNHVVRVSGVDPDEIQFCNKKSEKALRVTGTDNKFKIPDALIEEPYNIIGYVVKDQITINEFYIPVKSRPAPDYF